MPRFLASLLILGQIAWTLPAYAQNTLRPGQEAQTRASGLEEALHDSTPAEGFNHLLIVTDDYQIYQAVSNAVTEWHTEKRRKIKPKVALVTATSSLEGALPDIRSSADVLPYDAVILDPVRDGRIDVELIREIAREVTVSLVTAWDSQGIARQEINQLVGEGLLAGALLPERDGEKYGFRKETIFQFLDGLDAAAAARRSAGLEEEIAGPFQLEGIAEWLARRMLEIAKERNGFHIRYRITGPDGEGDPVPSLLVVQPTTPIVPLTLTFKAELEIDAGMTPSESGWMAAFSVSEETGFFDAGEGPVEAPVLNYEIRILHPYDTRLKAMGRILKVFDDAMYAASNGGGSTVDRILERDPEIQRLLQSVKMAPADVYEIIRGSRGPVPALDNRELALSRAASDLVHLMRLRRVQGHSVDGDDVLVRQLLREHGTKDFTRQDCQALVERTKRILGIPAAGMEESFEAMLAKAPGVVFTEEGAETSDGLIQFAFEGNVYLGIRSADDAGGFLDSYGELHVVDAVLSLLSSRNLNVAQGDDPILFSDGQMGAPFIRGIGYDPGSGRDQPALVLQIDPRAGIAPQEIGVWAKKRGESEAVPVTLRLEKSAAGLEEGDAAGRVGMFQEVTVFSIEGLYRRLGPEAAERAGLVQPTLWKELWVPGKVREILEGLGLAREAFARGDEETAVGHLDGVLGVMSDLRDSPAVAETNLKRQRDLAVELRSLFSRLLQLCRELRGSLDAGDALSRLDRFETVAGIDMEGLKDLIDQLAQRYELQSAGSPSWEKREPHFLYRRPEAGSQPVSWNGIAPLLTGAMVEQLLEEMDTAGTTQEVLFFIRRQKDTYQPMFQVEGSFVPRPSPADAGGLEEGHLPLTVVPLNMAERLRYVRLTSNSGFLSYLNRWAVQMRLLEETILPALLAEKTRKGESPFQIKILLLAAGPGDEQATVVSTALKTLRDLRIPLDPEGRHGAQLLVEAVESEREIHEAAQRRMAGKESFWYMSSPAIGEQYRAATGGRARAEQIIQVLNEHREQLPGVVRLTHEDAASPEVLSKIPQYDVVLVNVIGENEPEKNRKIAEALSKATETWVLASQPDFILADTRRETYQLADAMRGTKFCVKPPQGSAPAWPSDWAVLQERPVRDVDFQVEPGTFAPGADPLRALMVGTIEVLPSWKRFPDITRLGPYDGMLSAYRKAHEGLRRGEVVLPPGSVAVLRKLQGMRLVSPDFQEEIAGIIALLPQRYVAWVDGILAGGLEEGAILERWQGMRSAAPELHTVVIGPSVAARFPALRALAGLEEHFLVDEGPDTVVRLAGQGVRSVAYYGGLEEAETFSAMAGRALIAVEARSPSAPEFLLQLREILILAGIPENVLAAGLEEFAAELSSLAPAA